MPSTPAQRRRAKERKDKRSRDIIMHFKQEELKEQLEREKTLPPAMSAQELLEKAFPSSKKENM